MKYRLGKTDLRHTQIANGGAERRIVDGNADHQPEREKTVHQRLAPLAAGGEFVVDVQRLRVVGEAAEQRVVQFGYGAADRVLEGTPDLEVFQIEAMHCALLLSSETARTKCARPDCDRDRTS